MRLKSGERCRLMFLCLSSVSDLVADDEKVEFTVGMKQSTFETLMTKEEIEEEQR